MRRVGANGVDRDFGHPMQLIDSDQHQQCGSHANQRMRPKTRRPAVQGPFKANESPDGQCARNPAQNH
jgi:hypothetical protein